MRRKINIEKLSEVIQKLMEKSDLIKHNKMVLLNDIERISYFYKGADSEIIKKKYMETANNIDVFINTIDSYINYFKWLSGNYEENLLTTKTSIESLEFENFKKNELDSIIINDIMFPNL